jgi:hypothetical protein
MVMSEDGKDAGLVAMISGILGGGKRTSAPVSEPPPLAEAPPTIPSDPEEGASAPKPPSTRSTAERTVAPAPQAEAVEPLDRVAIGPTGKRQLPATMIASLVLGELKKIDGFPESGASITVYGYQHWNAMITFAPFSTTFERAKRFRQALPDLVFKLRQHVELEI